MAFSSIAFFLLLPFVYFIFLITPKKFRWSVLLAVSIAFYALAGAPYLLIVLAFSITISYTFGLWLSKTDDSPKQNILLGSGIALLVIPILILRYLPMILVRSLPGTEAAGFRKSYRCHRGIILFFSGHLLSD